MNQTPILVTATSSFCFRYSTQQMQLSGSVCKFSPSASREEVCFFFFFQRLVTDLWILDPVFPACSSRSSLLAALPHAGIGSDGCGDAPQSSAASPASSSCSSGVHGQHQAQHILTAAPQPPGLSEDLEAAVHRKLCSEAAGMINSQMGPGVLLHRNTCLVNTP